MTLSSLASRADKVSTHLRPQKTSDGWAGDEVTALTQVSNSLRVRLEWSEGKNKDWDVWSFDGSADLQELDILIFTDPALAITITRITTFARLSGGFHHSEILATEHEKSVADLLAAVV